MTADPISLFRSHELLAIGAIAPVAAPLGEPVSQVRSVAMPGLAQAAMAFGIARLGVWRRQVVEAEFCHFLAGEAIFRPDDGEPLHITGGDTVYFPPRTGGTWEILRDSEKIFIVFDEVGAAR